MKNVILGTLLTGTLVSLAGCGTTTSSNTAHITGNWAIKNVAGGAFACPTGYDTAAIVSQEVDANGNNVGAPITDLFNCADGHGVTAGLYPTTYKVWIQITDTTGAQIYAQSLAAYVDLTVADKTFTADIFDDGGYFSLAWSLVAKSNNAATTCAAAASATVDVAGTLSGPAGTLTDFRFPCTDNGGITAVFAAGTYTVSVAAEDTSASHLSVGTAPAITNSVIKPQNQVTSLGTVVIPIDAL
jgi:hypothetical protein